MDQASIHTKPRAIKITVKGRVQGVGFRPFIFQLADEYGIKGTVQNNMDGVKIYAEGDGKAIEDFVASIQSKSPRLSRIDQVEVIEVAFSGFQIFSIIPSERTGKSSLVIPIDSAVCDDCLDEMRDPKNFRYRYPFINCTQCGPRYTIIEALPYDRPYTVMKEFDMCNECKDEYEDPMNRRHHAQPIACGTCGPEVCLKTMKGEVVAKQEEAMSMASSLLHKGKIIAIKGIGGYHLACDAFNDIAVSTLRERKGRPSRPLAVMAATVNVVKEICLVSDQERDVLKSPEAPIVIMNKKRDSGLADGLAPGLNTIGVMLPYTPLHHLLFDEGEITVLVMTSANPSGLPMLYQDEEAFSYLDGIADYVLSNTRGILHPLDDSVVQFIDGKMAFLRRSRGYVPDPMVTNQPIHGVVALGPQQKNTFAIGRHEQIFIGPHIGEMENLEVVNHFQHEFHHLMKWMGIQAETIAVDMHPGYMTSELAEKMEGEVIPVQHHHAHMVSCMEDNGINDTAFGIILDGTGYGEDGHIWGFEILYGDASSYKRLAHLKYTHLPGNEKAINEPWRNATAMLVDYFGDYGRQLAERLFHNKVYEIEILTKMINKELNSPLAGTCGRLFDAVSAILGICEVATYDGEAAIRLSEQMIEGASVEPYPYEMVQNSDSELEIIDFGPSLLSIVKERLNGVSIKTIVQKFHETIVAICVDRIVSLSKKNPDLHKNVVLSGGSFHNPFLSKEIANRLRDKEFQVFTHERVPCNDGGLSLGQLIIAANKKYGQEMKE
ncbi:carbamoyltransferase HypF [Bacillus massilinigeriensis]|uniref:carbamoyltransferase HypF n=1 Tax=Bacillus massilionigeriensis TaxID=1805475 RepID=UPI00096B20D0|nr:carbamoyltransferase HypF [Bacillus massilionigeriensis]